MVIQFYCSMYPEFVLFGEESQYERARVGMRWASAKLRTAGHLSQVESDSAPVVLL